MPKGNRFKLILVPAVATALLAFGCDPSGGTFCVDANGQRVPDARCTGKDRAFYHWYHASGGGASRVARSAVHGGTTRVESGISRGGFGSSAHSFGHVGG